MSDRPLKNESAPGEPVAGPEAKRGAQSKAEAAGRFRAYSSGAAKIFREVESERHAEDLALLERTRAESVLRELINQQRPGLGDEVRIHFTNNTCTMVSKYTRNGVAHLRVHHLFAKAPTSLLVDLVRFCFVRVQRKTSRRIRAALMDFVEEHKEDTLVEYPRARTRPPRGEFYNLVSIAERVQKTYVPELETKPEIAWTRQAHRTLMGKWVPTPNGQPNLVLVNRLLDNERVPLNYVEFIVFHELLHELMPISRACGRWVHHPPEFKQRERQFPTYDQAQKWEEDNLGRLYAAYKRRKRR